jgi:hypothetical protein
VYDGMNDPNVGALNNWENIGLPEEATQSMIYDGSAMGCGKEKWCAACHDSSSVGELVFAVDDFEGYISSSDLRTVWVGKHDAVSTTQRFNPNLSASSVPDPQGSESMEVDVWWEKSTLEYGSVQRVYNPVLDLDEANAVGFWLRVESTSRFSNIKVRITNNSGTSVTSIATVDFNDFGMVAWEWKWIQLYREDFTNNADWSSVEKIQFRARENYVTSSYHVSFWLDDIKFLNSSPLPPAPNVVGDNQTWGYYVTGHKMNCSWCHDVNSDHIDDSRLSIFEYIKNTANPTNFRFYSDPNMQMELPYSRVYGTEKFALCYKCHEESWLTESANPDPNPGLMTNFREDDDWMPATTEHNLHRYHLMDGDVLIAGYTTCVLCHDPHGQWNPAMNRIENGDLAYSYLTGGDIPDRVVDANTNDVPDWYDPEVNRWGSMKAEWDSSFCIACHNDPGESISNYYRSYKQLPHTGGLLIGSVCFTSGCHTASQNHATHFVSDKSPCIPPDEGGCYYCHADGRLQCADSARFVNIEDPEGPPLSLDDTTVCDSCHN